MTPWPVRHTYDGPLPRRATPRPSNRPGVRCTHLSCAVVPRPERGELHCPCHVGSFEMTSGRPVAGPPRRPLPRIALEVRGGVVYATGVEERTV